MEKNRKEKKINKRIKEIDERLERVEIILLEKDSKKKETNFVTKKKERRIMKNEGKGK